MSASSVLRSARCVVRWSIPQTEGSFHRSPVRLLSGGAGTGRFDPNEHSRSKPNMGDKQRLESGSRICRAAENQKEWDEFASDLRVVRDKIRVWEQNCKEFEKGDRRRERVLLCACVLFVAFCVFA